MPRTIEVTVESNRTEELLSRLKQLKGVVGLRLHRNASIVPPGDVVTIQATNDASPRIFDLLVEFEIPDRGLIRTNQDGSLIVAQHETELHHEASETIWEEMINLLREQSNVRWCAIVFSLKQVFWHRRRALS